MSKLGYTWYPKDWGNSESVFELTLIERGLYRELIDMAMLNDNKTPINIKTWARKFGSSVDEIEGILITLTELKLIELVDDILFIPSCESRLQLVRGGKKSKPTTEAISNLKNQKSEPISEPISEQIEKKEKVKEIRNKFTPPTILEVESYFIENGYTKESGTKAFNYYAVADWKDSKGNQVKNWKQKMQAVWFKDENKTESNETLPEHLNIDFTALIGIFNRRFRKSNLIDLPQATKKRFLELLKCGYTKEDISKAIERAYTDELNRDRISLEMFSFASNIDKYKNFQQERL